MGRVCGFPLIQWFLSDIVQAAFHLYFSKKHAEEISGKIFANKTFPPSYYSPTSSLVKDKGTTHVSVVGPDGEIVTVTR